MNHGKYISTFERGFEIWESPIISMHYRMNRLFIELGADMNREIANRHKNPYIKWHAPLGIAYHRLFNAGVNEITVLAISSTSIDGSPLILCGRWMPKADWIGRKKDFDRLVITK